MAKLKFGIIGLGGIAQLIHLPDLIKNKETEVTAIADINKRALAEVAAKFRIPNYFTDYKEMLKKMPLDAVIIATPTKTHQQIAVDCLDANKHILVEKPLARSGKEAEMIVEKSEQKNLIAMVGMNMRFRPDIMLLKSIIGSGDIGEPYYIKSSWFKTQSSSAKWFTTKDEAGGGVIFDLGIVLIDVALWFLDFPVPTTVSTQNFSQHTKNIEDSSISMIRTAKGQLISIESSWTMLGEKDSFNLEVYCTRGNAFINPLRITKVMDGQFVEMKPMVNDNRKIHFEKSYQNELNHFIGAINGHNPLLSSARDSASRLKLIEAMYLSAQKKTEVKL
ncbi:MAG: Gfo/Idh/MocA family oxidoreductase [Ignavibacteriales bacterium]|nr:MAG: Gfo/Idh/MocA family oxidoreductase [Ignavibacteriaceae bacterium]MBW7871874.1 Gfo/Idh/MocA family oxidoreductase [Ignavibacteria bacterium]MCZ2144276.1 Gfo/Idh/MocA family oxidoreductase [Ignavibacteriales bacterium]OQY74796.1 MAG: dehydrogenase [Ignavibacteriales bacterium UTCHB3]MBV6446229.1 Myo-inositol 2-dehydrogenase [Ignavibacteriaceae bacterium]